MADVPIVSPPAEVWTAGPAINPLSDPYTGSESPAPMPAAPDMGYCTEHGPPDTSGSGYQYGNGAGPNTAGVGYNGMGMGGGGSGNPQ